MFQIIQEDATRYLPHNPTGIEYEHRVYSTASDWNPITRQYQRRLVFTGSRAECESYVERREAAHRRVIPCG
jgi:hypothetical protein